MATTPDRLADLRTRAQLTQAQACDRLAELLGRPLPRARLSEWERSVHTPSAQVLAAIAAAYGCPCRDLVGIWRRPAWPPLK